MSDRYLDNIGMIQEFVKKSIEREYAFKKLHRNERITIIGFGSSYNQACLLARILADHGLNANCDYMYSGMISQREFDTLIIISQGASTTDFSRAAAVRAHKKIVFTANPSLQKDTRFSEVYLFDPKKEDLLARSVGVISGFILVLRYALFQTKTSLDLSTIGDNVPKALDWHAQPFCFVADSYLLPVAAEGALKLRECAFCPAWFEETKNLAHGPIFQLLEMDTHFVFIPTQKETLSGILPVLKKYKKSWDVLLPVYGDYRDAICHLWTILVSTSKPYKEKGLNLAQPPYLADIQPYYRGG